MRPARPKWTAAEDEYIRANYATAPITEMSAHLGRTDNAIWNRGQFLKLSRENCARFKPGNVPINKGKARTDGRFPLMLKCEELLRQHPDGLTQHELAERIGCLASSVSFALQIMRRAQFCGARIDRWVPLPPRHWVAKYVIGHGRDAAKPKKEEPIEEPVDPCQIVPVPRPAKFLWGQCISAQE